jgi:hypothetical protein
MIKNVLKATCDRCGTTTITDADDEYVDSIPEWLILRRAYGNEPVIHLCPGCRNAFMLFMMNVTVQPRDKDKPEDKELENNSLSDAFGFGGK